ncbi:MAG: HD domain-containing protein [Anaerolineae bacterium]
MTQNAQYLFEVGMLNQIPRSGFAFLGSGRQSIAEHSFRATHIAWLLARLAGEPVDLARLLQLILFHDLPEARTGDFNYVNHKYDSVNEVKLYADLTRELPFGAEVVALVQEFEARATPEARLANDADQLELLLMLKEQQDLGNPRAADWVPSALARLKTNAGRTLAEEILTTPSEAWWFSDKQDRHWIDRGRAIEPK